DSGEELRDLPLPAPQILTQDRFPFSHRHLDGPEALAAVSEQQLALAGRAQVSHPLRLPPWRDEIAAATARKQIDWHAARLAAPPAPHLQDPRAPETDPHPRGRGHQPVEYPAIEPTGPSVWPRGCHPRQANEPQPVDGHARCESPSVTGRRRLIQDDLKSRR